MGQARSSIVQIQSEYQRDLLCSFQPIFFLMRFLGIELNVSQSYSKFRRFGFLTLAILMLIYNVIATYLHYKLYEVSGNRGTASYWVALVKQCTLTASGILIPLILFAITIFKWKPLWKKVHEMEHFLNFQSNPLLQLRKTAICTSIMVIGYIITVINLEI